MSFPQLLTSRRLGEPEAQGKIEEALNQKIENALVNDCFHSTTIELPKNFTHSISRCQDFVAVLSENPKTQQVALWSLITKGKLWEVKIATDSDKLNLNFCKLSKHGMILIDLPSSSRKIILLNGKRSGTLPNLTWDSINLVGTRILGCWRERRYPNHPGLSWSPENTNFFFGEYDENGNSLNRYQLDYTEGRWTHICTSNENYWVRLSASEINGLASIIEVVDRVMGKMKTYILPLSPTEEQFSSAYLVQDRLFYGKNLIDPGFYNIKIKHTPTISIFDLVKGEPIEEFPAKAKIGTPENLVATPHYVAWLECKEGIEGVVKYLDLLNKTTKVATTLSYKEGNKKINLNIFGTILTIIYAQDPWRGRGKLWHKKVVDMTNGELKCDVEYKRVSQGNCSIQNGNLLITDCFSSQPSMYIESFSDERISNEESTFRDKPQPNAQANFFIQI